MHVQNGLLKHPTIRTLQSKKRINSTICFHDDQRRKVLEAFRQAHGKNDKKDNMLMHSCHSSLKFHHNKGIVCSLHSS